MDKKMIFHKLLEQKFANRKWFSRETQHMFSFRHDRNYDKYVYFVRGEEVNGTKFNEEYDAFMILVDKALKIKGYTINSKNYYSCKSERLNEIGQYDDFLFSEEEREVFYLYKKKTEQELEKIINEAECNP